MKLVKVLLPLAAVGLIMGTASARDIDGFYGKVVRSGREARQASVPSAVRCPPIWRP